MKIYPVALLFGLAMISMAAWSFTMLPQHVPPKQTNDPSVEKKSMGHWIDEKVRTFKSQATNIETKVLRTGLLAYEKAKQQGLAKKHLLTIIDYSKPSNERRLWVFDLKNSKTLFNTWVSHGKNSGGLHATSFSNRPGSLKSSIGVFLTGSSYQGGKGISMHLKGLENGFNQNAYRRSVVFHGARYVNPDSIRTNGRAGRSWGCPAVSTALARPLINTIKENSLVVAYYPDRKWLKHSRFLNK